MQAKEIGTDFNFGQNLPKMKNSIRDSYLKEGVPANVVQGIELELHGLEAIYSESVAVKKEKIGMTFSFSSSYVRDENDGVSDICTVTLQATATYRLAGTWTITSTSCEAYD